MQWTINSNTFWGDFGGKLTTNEATEREGGRSGTSEHKNLSYSSSTRQSTMIVATHATFFCFKLVSPPIKMLLVLAAYITQYRDSPIVCVVFTMYFSYWRVIWHQGCTQYCVHMRRVDPTNWVFQKFSLTKWMDSITLCKQSKVNSPTPACS